MFRYRAYLRKRQFEDKASATLTTLVISLPFLLLTMAFCLDMYKNLHVKASMTSMAQQAAEAGIKHLDANGSMGVPAVNAVVGEYTNQNYSTWSNSLVDGGSGGEHADEIHVYRGGTCGRQDVKLTDGTDVGMKTLPYMRIALKPARSVNTYTGDVVFESEGGSQPTLISGSLDATVTYKVIATEIHDSSPNLMMGWFGHPCQAITSTESAIAFGSNEDLAGSQK